MSRYVYEEHTVVSFSAIRAALAAAGDADAIIELNGALCITSTLSQAAVDLTVVAAAADGFESNRALKREQVEVRSGVLAGAGVAVTVGSVTGIFATNNPRYDFAYYEALVSKATRDATVLPFNLGSADGKLLTLSSLADVKSLTDTMMDRLKYIYLDQTNVDLSKGELGYILDINAASDQAALDLIIDTRI